MEAYLVEWRVQREEDGRFGSTGEFYKGECSCPGDEMQQQSMGMCPLMDGGRQEKIA